jgi:regulatory protein
VSGEEFARQVALRLLNMAPRSRARLAEAMAKRGVEPAVTQRVLDRFEEVGLVDDQALADMLVRTRHSERGLVGRALAVELARYGIDRDCAAAAMEQISLEDQQAKAEQLAAAKLRATANLPREVRIRRTAAMLGRKGYPPGTAMSVINAYLAEEQS